MQMTNEEIVRSYREAKHKKEQVGILADLNACTRGQIIDILRAGGIDGRALSRLDGKKPIKANTAAELLGQAEPDFTAITARVKELIARRDDIEQELASISETMRELLARIDEGGPV